MNDIYAYTVPAMLRGLETAKTILAKSKAFVDEKGIDESEFIQSRLWPDMFPFVKQVQIVTDNAKGAVSRLTATENPSFPDTEDSFDALVSRIDRTIAFVQSVPESAFSDAENAKIVLPFMPEKFLTARDYIQQFFLPNFYFHLTTAYDIARMSGVTLKKSEYLGELSLNDLPA